MKNVIPKRILDILNQLKNNGFDAYLVGGCVRDFLLNKTPKDYDISTNATVSEMLEVFKDFHVINNNGLKHNTVSVYYMGDVIEVTSYKNKNDYSIYGDLYNRDLTINAIAYDNGFIDPLGGINDIKNKIIRVCNENSFKDDYLRILRTLRFASKLNFDIVDDTKHLIKENYKGLEGISKERINNELCQILEGDNVLNILLEYKEVFSFIIPSLANTIDFDQKNKYHLHNVYTHSAYVVSYCKNDYITRLAALLHDAGKPNCFTIDENGYGHFYGHPLESYHLAKDVLKDLKFSNKEMEEILFLVRFHDDVAVTKKQIKRMLAKTPDNKRECFLRLIDLQHADRKDHINLEELDIENMINILEEIIAEEECFTIKDLEVNGYDLMELGVFDKRIKEIQLVLLDLVVEEKIENKKEILIDYIKNNLL
jgi:tRNA nucleotidyltransferase (CCA-adding enzyme)